MTSSSFDPIARGRHPVGVRASTVVDVRRDGRTLPVEVWYPAHEAHRGEDLDRSTMDLVRIPIPGGATTRQAAVRDARPAGLDALPLAVFSHGHAGYRFASTFLTTHLASHGFVVVAPDHVDDTMVEVLATPRDQQGARSLQSAIDRPQDVGAVIDAALDPATPLGGELASRLDPGRIGVVGHSFGGFTALVASTLDPRIGACVPHAPPGILDRALDPLKVGNSYRGLPLGERSVPTLILAADRDSLCLLEGIDALFAQLGAPKALAVLEPADHFHFADSARAAHDLFRTFLQSGATGHRPLTLPPFEELLEEDIALTIVRALTTAFLRGALLGDAAPTLVTAALAASFEGRVRWRSDP
ncbi:MAG: dienelactone hydrolase family protein [Deltaproteobacteria bacterium]|nr:dienelactone hydrolase family protein [Deltaproteobacteria bacterium]